jgi:hypothetical protein
MLLGLIIAFVTAAGSSNSEVLSKRQKMGAKAFVFLGVIMWLMSLFMVFRYRIRFLMYRTPIRSQLAIEMHLARIVKLW